MKSYIFLYIFVLFSISILAQETDFSSFIPEEYNLISASGPGISNSSGDLILQLEHAENDFSLLVLLRKTNGKIQKIAEIETILMNNHMLGASGDGSVSLDEKKLIIEYLIGTSSSQSSVSIEFQKDRDKHYYFQEYLAKNRSYGVENLFERIGITSNETGKINFAEATEENILKYAKSSDQDIFQNSEKTEKIIAKINHLLPKEHSVVDIAIGDLNLDPFKEDVLVLLVNNNDNSKTILKILLQQKDGNYNLASSNRELFTLNTDADPSFGYIGGMNFENVRLIITNGFSLLKDEFMILKITITFQKTVEL